MKTSRRLNRKIRWLAGFIVLGAALLPGGRVPTRYSRLESYISETRLIDVHAHPSARHVDPSGDDIYPTLEPPIGRPYWPILKDRIAVFDSLEPAALRAVYGYAGTDIAKKDLAGLRALSRKFWEAGGPAGLDRVLDICGVERVLADSEEPRSDVDPARVAWVPFVDCFLFPFAAPSLKSVPPRLRETIDACSGAGEARLAKSGGGAAHLGSYLDSVDAALESWKRRGAAALKLGIAYHRTLWFDDPGWEEAAALYAEGRQGTLDSWGKYMKVQDVIARRVFLKAGELGLPVHIHTGFGADARLKTTDSNPLNLESVLTDLRFRNTRFLILHAGYPFWKELKPLLEKRNVFVDFSAVNWMVFEDELAQILAGWLAYPGAADKIMFGSDAGAPVFFWIAAHNSRQALYRALAGLIDKGIIDEDKAVLLAGKIMRENALRLHNLK
jgi:predicted TIM-barrel fold metal-dependent hydrolase